MFGELTGLDLARSMTIGAFLLPMACRVLDVEAEGIRLLIGVLNRRPAVWALWQVMRKLLNIRRIGRIVPMQAMVHLVTRDRLARQADCMLHLARGSLDRLLVTTWLTRLMRLYVSDGLCIFVRLLMVMVLGIRRPRFSLAQWLGRC